MDSKRDVTTKKEFQFKSFEEKQTIVDFTISNKTPTHKIEMKKPTSLSKQFKNGNTMVNNVQKESKVQKNQSPEIESKTEGPKTVANDNIETITSEMSIGFGELANDLEEQYPNVLIKDGPELYQTILRTICAYGIRCIHGRIPVKKLKTHNGFWLPYAYADENDKYLNVVHSIYESFLDEKTKSSNNDPNFCLTNIQLYNIYRFQIPDGRFISRYIFLAQWPQNSTIVCCKDTDIIHWLQLECLSKETKHSSSRRMLETLWGNEVLIVASILFQQHSGVPYANYPNITEFTGNEVLRFVPSSNRSSASDQMLELLNEARITEKDIIKVYCDYVQHCFPAMNMTYCSFQEYFNKMDFQFDNNVLPHLFRSMCHKNKNFMLFHEFLLGLAALDSSSLKSHLRCSYIFRFYDRNADNFLDEDDFRRMIYDVHEKANLSIDPEDVENDVQMKLSTANLLDHKRRISFEAFVRETSTGLLSRVRYLFRSNKPIMETIQTRHLYEYIDNKSGKPFATRIVGICPRCRPKNYSLAYHVVKMNKQGHIDSSCPLVDLNCGEIDADLQFKNKSNDMEIKHSMEIVFNANSVANQVLAIIRTMYDFRKLSRDRRMEVSQNVIAHLTVDLIIQLCKDVSEILSVEPRVLKINTPCLIMGDLHGNINDLLTYEKQLWPLAPSSNAPNILFLGDYVDRGDYSIEVVCYLFAMKILTPKKFFLLRGNHEIRSVQKNFTFARECHSKYPLEHGQKLFEEFNLAFDLLPLVGIIDESIFCAHGGIPYSVTKIEELYKIPIPLEDPESQSKSAWEILWSDPVSDEEYNQVCQFKNQTIDNGFTDNLRRSTAYYFSEKALKNFLKVNNLTHVIRAHELENKGYRFHHSGQLITIFSSSRYCNTNNKSAAVFVNSNQNNEGIIKVISLET